MPCLPDYTTNYAINAMPYHMPFAARKAIPNTMPCAPGHIKYSTARGFFPFPTHPSGADLFASCSPTQGSTQTLAVIL